MSHMLSPRNQSHQVYFIAYIWDWKWELSTGAFNNPCWVKSQSIEWEMALLARYLTESIYNIQRTKTLNINKISGPIKRGAYN